MLDAVEKFEAAFVKLQYHDAKYKKHLRKRKLRALQKKKIGIEQGYLLNS